MGPHLVDSVESDTCGCYALATTAAKKSKQEACRNVCNLPNLIGAKMGQEGKIGQTFKLSTHMPLLMPLLFSCPLFIIGMT
jgi:hypothetical protein